MKIKPADIKIATEDEARAYLNTIFVGTAQVGCTTKRLCYCKPSSESMRVITYYIDPGIVRFGVATLGEFRDEADPSAVTYNLTNNAVKIEYTMPSCVLDLLTGIKVLITPIFERVAQENIEAAMKSYLKLAKPKIEW